MKKLVLSLAAAASLVACNPVPQAPANDSNSMNTLDTAGLAAYQQSKTQPNIITSELEQKEEAAAPVAKAAPAKVRTVTRYVDVPVKRATPKPAPTREPASEPAASSNSGSTASSGSEQGTGAGAGTETSTASTPAPAEKKKGWSKAAKGAVIGGVAGAVGGAIINKKNRGAGAVIGGIIGAAGGYGVGRGQDKKDGRNVDIINQ